MKIVSDYKSFERKSIYTKEQTNQPIKQLEVKSYTFFFPNEFFNILPLQEFCFHWNSIVFVWTVCSFFYWPAVKSTQTDADYVSGQFYFERDICSWCSFSFVLPAATIFVVLFRENAKSGNCSFRLKSFLIFFLLFHIANISLLSRMFISHVQLLSAAVVGVSTSVHHHSWSLEYLLGRVRTSTGYCPDGAGSFSCLRWRFFSPLLSFRRPRFT